MKEDDIIIAEPIKGDESELVVKFEEIINAKDLVACRIIDFPVIKEAASVKDRKWDMIPFDFMKIYKNIYDKLVLDLSIHSSGGYLFTNVSKLSLTKLEDQFIRFVIPKADTVLELNDTTVTLYFESKLERDQFFDFLQRF